MLNNNNTIYFKIKEAIPFFTLYCTTVELIILVILAILLYIITIYVVYTILINIKNERAFQSNIFMIILINIICEIPYHFSTLILHFFMFYPSLSGTLAHGYNNGLLMSVYFLCRFFIFQSSYGTFVLSVNRLVSIIFPYKDYHVCYLIIKRYLKKNFFLLI